MTVDDDDTVAAVGKVSEALEYVERRVRDDLVGGERHLFEARMKDDRRTRGRSGHEARP